MTTISGFSWQLSTGDGGPNFRLEPGEHVVGSAPDADLRLAHPTLSRHHARITCTEESVTVEDLGSTNGTSVDGCRLDGPVEVTAGATIVFGEVGCTLERRGPIARAATGSADRSSDLLGPTTMGVLRGAGHEIAFAAGDAILRRGEHQESLFVVVSGEVEIFLQEGESRRRPLARLGPGATFGAESVLSGEGSAVDAVALDEVRLLCYPAAALPAALEQSASLRRKLLSGIARHFHEATADVLDLLKGTEVITRLVQGDEDPDELVAASARMRTVLKRIEFCASGRGPVLVVGEAGTGRTLAARLIHQRSAYSDGALIAVSCRQLAPEHAADLILGEAAVSGNDSDNRGSGGIHLARGGTLLLRDVDTLAPAIQEALARALAQEDSPAAGPVPETRILATAGAARASDGTTRGLAEALLGCFEEVVQMPPLASRPRDIVPLAEAFLRRWTDDPPRLTETARHALLSMRYRRANVAELREVMDLAARVTDGPEIRGEHIFSGIGDEGVAAGLDITGSPLVRGLTQSGWVGALRAVTAAGFGLVILLCLMTASSSIGRAANASIWSAWEPAVFALFLLAGPLWCTVCPLSLASRLIKHIRTLERPPPEWVVRHGPWLTIVGFAAIVWSERVFVMTANPFGSGVLLATLVAAAAVCGLVYQREVWCRHLCPLGRLAVALAPACPLQLTARRSVCASTCQTHECYKGTVEIPGCTVFHHPLEAQQSHRCKLCLDCLRSCPHGSARLHLRLPLRAIWKLEAGAADIAMFAVAVSLLALVLRLPLRVPLVEQPLHFTVLCVLAIGLGIGLSRVLLGQGRGGAHRVTTMARVGVAAMLLGWAALMVSQLENVPLLDTVRVVIDPAGELPAWVPGQISARVVAQVALVVLACGAAALSLRRTRLAAGPEAAVGAVAWGVVQLAFLAYAVCLVLLI